ncbi:DUF748 domain-containing protein [Lentisphaera profundi]|uniref:DUF748 domain-containing protein n=1 Tax=Lentisphaera profundi TaxID=1658616 RepID=A0ABY7VQ39_9BACT|nr:DUF748 domain-containing protein [Lentisphaera profundi]WDE96107.1 DUF748 domain-containing protein [Lentisphaera profundi]
MLKNLSAVLGQTKKSRRIRITLLSCTLFYFIFLGLIAPLIIRSQAKKHLSELIKRPVEIEKISINPFCNSISIKNFAILEKNQTSFLRWDEVYINFELSSIFTFSWNFDEIAIRKPQVQISRLSASLFNFSDIIETLNNLPKAEEVEESSGLPPLFIRSFTISNGQVKIKDKSRSKEKSLEVPLINLSVSNFHTKIYKDNNNRYDFRILTEHDAGLHWKGQVNLDPFESNGSVNITGAKIKNISDVFNDELPFTILSGDIGLNFNYQTSIKDEISFHLSKGNASLDQLQVQYKDQSPLIELSSFNISNFSYDLVSNQLIVPLIEIKDSKAYSTLLETGLPKSLKLTDLDAFSQALIGDQQVKSSTPATNPKDQSISPINFLVKEFRGNQLNVYFTDESTTAKPHAKIEQLTFEFKNLSNLHSENFTFASQFQLNDTAKFELKSQGALFPVKSTGNIQLNNFQLDFSNPYLNKFELPITIQQGSLLQQADFDIALNNDYQLIKGELKTEIELIDFSLKDTLTNKELFSDTKLLKAYESVDAHSRIHILGELDLMTRKGSGEFHIRSINLANAAEHFATELPFKVISGELEFMSRAQIQFGDELKLSTSDGALNLSSLVIQELNSKELINLEHFLIDKVSANLNTKELNIANVELKGLQINAHLNKGKELNLIRASDFTKLMKALEKYEQASAEEKPLSPSSPQEAHAPLAWNYQIQKVDLSQMNLQFTDDALGQGSSQNLNDMHLEVTELNNKKDHSFKSSFKATINQDAQLKVTSKTSLTPIKLESTIMLDSLSLTSLQNYLSQFVNAKLAECLISTESKLTYIDGQASLSGNFLSSKFQLNDLNNSPVASFESFAIKEFNIDPQKLIIKVDEVQLESPKMYLAIDSNAQVNLSKILKKTTTPDKKEKGNDEIAPSSTLKPQIEIKKFTLDNAHAKFNDASISPKFSISLDKFSGSVNKITNAPDQQSDWTFQGLVNNHAPLNIKGNSRFLASPFALNMALDLNNLGLTSFSPYSGTFIGYKLQEGQLSLKMNYTLENNELDGKNQVLMSRFELGQSVDSDKAVNLPIKLGVALIRDYNKNIDLDLNIHGNINDPSFSVLNLIWKVFTNIIVKAATSPFSLLANLAKSGQKDLNSLQFDAGEKLLIQSEQDKLKTLSEALAKRPTLALNITGYFDHNIDRDQLKKQHLNEKIVAESTLLREENSSIENAELLVLAKMYEAQSGETWKALQTRVLGSASNEKIVYQEPEKTTPRRSFRSRTGKFQSRRARRPSSTQVDVRESSSDVVQKNELNDIEKLAQKKEIEQIAFDFLLENFKLEDHELEDLAINRAKVVKQYLIEELKIPASRLFLLAPKEAKSQKTVELNLDAL